MKALKKVLLYFAYVLGTCLQTNIDLSAQNCSVVNIDFPMPNSDTLLLCAGDPPIVLLPYVNLLGGSFEGVGVSANVFTPSVAGTGVFEILYILGTDSCLAFINVVPISLTFPTPSPNALYLCADEAPIDLSIFANPSGGSFSGNGITGSVFDPLQAGTGIHEVSYSLGNDVCQQTITVMNVDFETPNNVLQTCIGDPPESLLQYAQPFTGVFSGDGVIDNNFHPNIAGSGLHQITYTVGAGSCAVLVEVSNVDISFPPPIQNQLVMCFNDSIVDLLQYASPVGGFFVGTGIVDNHFYPSMAGPGTHGISYILGNDTCTKSIRVFGVGLLAQMDPLPTYVCQNTPPIALSGNASENYAFYLNQFFNSITEYNPALRPIGTDTIIYTVLDASTCSSHDTSIVEIIAPTNSQIFLPKTHFCESEAITPISLNPSGGILSASGNLQITPDNKLDIPNTPVGQYTLYYHYTDSLGACTDVDSLFIDVFGGTFFDINVTTSDCSNELDQIRYIGPSPADSLLLNWSIDQYSIQENRGDTLLLVKWENEGAYTINLEIAGADCSSVGNLLIQDVASRPDIDCIVNVFIPNIFTPNNDGVNDEFGIMGIGIANARLHIYDRWGSKVFEASDISQTWDGTLKSEAVEAGVFYYFAEIELMNGNNIIQEGNVTLVR